MSRLLEAAQNKPADLTKAEATIKELCAERQRALEVRSQLNAELREGREMLEEAEYKAGNAEAKARIDGNKADTKALEAARKKPLDGPGQCGAPRGYRTGSQAKAGRSARADRWGQDGARGN